MDKTSNIEKDLLSLAKKGEQGQIVPTPQNANRYATEALPEPTTFGTQSEGDAYMENLQGAQALADNVAPTPEELLILGDREKTAKEQVQDFGANVAQGFVDVAAGVQGSLTQASLDRYLADIERGKRKASGKKRLSDYGSVHDEVYSPSYTRSKEDPIARSKRLAKEYKENYRSSQRLDEFNKELGNLYSAQARLENASSEHITKKRSDVRKARAEELIGRGEYGVKEVASDFWESLSDAAEVHRPSQLVLMAARSLPSFLSQAVAGGVAGKLAANVDSARKLGAAMGIGVGAAQEALNNANEIMLEVLDEKKYTTDALKKDSPVFNDLLDMGYNEQDARYQLASDMYTTSLMTNFAIVAGAGKLTGAAGAVGNLFNPASKIGQKVLTGSAKEGAESGFKALGKVVTHPVVAGAKEASEEGITSAASAVVKDSLVQSNLDENKIVGLEAGSEAYLGAAAGGILGAGVPVTVAGTVAGTKLAKGAAIGTAKIATGSYKAAKGAKDFFKSDEGIPTEEGTPKAKAPTLDDVAKPEELKDGSLPAKYVSDLQEKVSSTAVDEPVTEDIVKDVIDRAESTEEAELSEEGINNEDLETIAKHLDRDINEYKAMVANLKETADKEDVTFDELGTAAYNLFNFIGQVHATAEQLPERIREPYRSATLDALTGEGSYLESIAPMLKTNEGDKLALKELLSKGKYSEGTAQQLAIEVGSLEESNIKRLKNKILYSDFINEDPNEGFSAQELQDFYEVLQNIDENIVTPSEARIIKRIADSKTFRQVANEVSFGNDSLFKGMSVHLNEMVEAFNRKDTAALTATTKRIENFRNSRVNKISELETAIQSRQEDVDNKVPEADQKVIQLDMPSDSTRSGSIEVATGLKGLNQAKKLLRLVNEDLAKIDKTVEVANAIVKGEPVDTTGLFTDTAEQDSPVAETNTAEPTVEPEATTEPEPEAPSEPSQFDLISDTNKARFDSFDSVQRTKMISRIRKRLENPNLTERGRNTMEAEVAYLEKDRIKKSEPVKAPVQEESAAPAAKPKQRVTAKPKQKVKANSNPDQLDLFEEAAQEEQQAQEQVATPESAPEPEVVQQAEPVEFEVSKDSPKNSLMDDLHTRYSEDVIQEEIATSKLSEETVRSRMENRIKRYFKLSPKSLFAKEGGVIERLRNASLESIKKVLPDANEADQYILGSALPYIKDLMANGSGSRLPSLGSIARDIIGKQGLYSYKFPLTLFLKENGRMAEDFLDAFSATALNFLTDSRNDLDSNSDSTMRRLLNIDSKAPISPEARELLQNAGLPMTYVADNLGETLWSALGLTSDNAPANYGATYKRALGQEVVIWLEKAGALKVTNLSNEALYNAGMLGSSQKGTTKYYSFNREGNSLLDVNTLIESVDTSSGAISNLMGKDRVNQVSFSPRKQSGKVIRSKVKTSPMQRKGNAVANKAANKINTTLFNLYDAFGSKEEFLTMLGYKPDRARNKNHAKTIEGKNRQLTKAMDMLLGLRERVGNEGKTLEEVDIHFDYANTKSGRQQSMNDITTMGEKLHRAFIQPVAKVKWDSRGEDKSMFLGLAQALDLDPDKKANPTSIAAVKEILENPDHPVTLVMDNLIDWFNGGSLNTNLLSNVISDMKGEPEHALMGIVEFAKYRDFIAKGEEGQSFETPMYYEVDGVTNGPFHAILQTVLNISEDTLTKLMNGGLFPDSFGVSHNDTREKMKDIMDNYNKVSSIATTNLKQIISEVRAGRGNNAQLAAIHSLGTMAKYINHLNYDPSNEDSASFTRNSTKLAVTATVYGSSAYSNSVNAVKVLIHELHAKADDLLDAVENDAVDYAVEQANILLQDMQDIAYVNAKGKYPVGSVNAENVQDFLENFTVSSGQEEAILKNYNAIIGESISSAIDTFFSDLLSIKDIMVSSSNIVNSLYIKAFKAARIQRRNALIESGELPEDGDLTTAQLAQLERDTLKFAPAYQQAVSEVENFSTYWNGANNYYADGIEGIGLFSSKNSDGSTINMMMKHDSIGVKVMPMLTISIDAAMQFLKYNIQPDTTDVNVHDAILGRVGEGLETSSIAINKADFIALKDFDMVRVVSDTFQRAVMNNPFYAAMKSEPANLGKAMLEGLLQVDNLTQSELSDLIASKDLPSNYSGMNKQAKARIDSMYANRKNVTTLVRSMAKLDPYIDQDKVLYKLPEYSMEDFGNFIEYVGNTLKEQADVTSKNKTALLSNGTFHQMSGVSGAALEYREGVPTDTTTTTPRMRNTSSSENNTLDSDGSGVPRIQDVINVLKRSNKPTMKILAKVLSKHKGAINKFNVKYTNDLPKGKTGAIQGNTILIATGLGESQKVATLAHEAIHAVMADSIAKFVAKGRKGDLNMVALDKMFHKVMQYGDVPPALKMAVDAYNSGDYYTGLQEFVAYSMVQNHEYAFSKPSNVKKFLKNAVKRVMEIFAKVLGTEVPANMFTDIAAVVYRTNTRKVTGDTNQNPILYSTDSSTKTAQEIFDSLKSTVNRPELVQAMKDISDRLIRKIDMLPNEIKNIESDADQEMVDALTPSVQVSHTQNVIGAFQMDGQARMVHSLYAESTLAALEGNYQNATPLYRMYNAARAKIKPEDFLDTNEPEGTVAHYVEMSKAIDKWNSVFKPSKGSDQFLANFAALSYSSPEFSELLKGVSLPSDKRDTIRDKVNGFITDTLDKLNHTFDVSREAPKRVQLLARRINKVKREGNKHIDTAQRAIDKTFTAADGKIHQSVSKVASAVNSALDNSRFKNLSNVAWLFDLVAGNQGEAEKKKFLNKAYDDFVTAPFMKKRGSQRLNVFAEAVNEVTRGSEGLQEVTDLRRRKVEKVDTQSQIIRDAVPETIASKFINLTKEDAVHLTKAAIQTDLSTLYANGIPLKDIVKAIQHPNGVDALISAYETKLIRHSKDRGAQNFWMNQAEHLGKYMVTGAIYLEGQLPNALTIAEGKGLEKGFGEQDPNGSLVRDIDVLATLYALKHTSQESKDAVVELATNDPEGVGYILDKHTELKNKEKAGLSGEGAYSQTKGASFDLMDPNASYRVVRKSEVEGYVKRGFTVGEKLRQDPLDPGEALYEVYSSEGGNAPWIQGALSMIDTSIGGVNPYTGNSVGGMAPNLGSTYTSRQIHANRVRGSNYLKFKRISKDEPSNNMIVSFTPNGAERSYRYVVPHAKKDTYMNRNLEVNHVFGHWEARLKEQEEARTHNETLLNHLNAKSSAANNLNKYIRVSSNSKDETVRNIHRMLPKHLKALQKELTGSTDIYVHPSEFNNVFGYRQGSVKELWDSEGKVAQAAIKVAEQFMGKRAAYYLRKGERGLQELAAYAKDFIVIRSIVVPAVNLVSNFASLSLRGVNLTDMSKYASEGIKAARQYKQLRGDLVRLKASDPTGSDSTIQSRISEIEGIMSKNPIMPLVEAGLMPTVVEDLGDHDNLFDMKGGIFGKLEQYTDKLPNSVKAVGSELLISRNSHIYSVMNEATELGDFVSKYVLYSDLMAKGELNQNQILTKVAHEFIDYGALSSRTLDYLNSIGMLHFMKYFMRIQSVLFNMIKENPSRVISMMAASAMGSTLSTPFDGSVMSTSLGYKTGIMDLMDGYFSHPLAKLV